jgi:hypothetical protein
VRAYQIALAGPALLRPKARSGSALVGPFFWLIGFGPDAKSEGFPQLTPMIGTSGFFCADNSIGGESLIFSDCSQWKFGAALLLRPTDRGGLEDAAP